MHTLSPVCRAVSSTPSRKILHARFSSVMPRPAIEPDVSSKRIVSRGISKTPRCERSVAIYICDALYSYFTLIFITGIYSDYYTHA